MHTASVSHFQDPVTANDRLSDVRCVGRAAAGVQPRHPTPPASAAYTSRPVAPVGLCPVAGEVMRRLAAGRGALERGALEARKRGLGHGAGSIAGATTILPGGKDQVGTG